MNFSIEKFDDLMAQAEDAAAGFDGKKLSIAMAALSTYMDAVVAQAVPQAALLEHMRERLQRYQRLCTFLQQTLHGVLVGALKGANVHCYKPQQYMTLAAPRGGQETHLAPLIRRYC